MGKYRAFIFLGLAFIFALITSFLIINYLQGKTKVKDAALDTQPAVVSKVDLKWGTMLTKEMLETKPFLKKSLPSGSSIDPSSLVGRVLISPVNTNEPILESKLAPTTLKTGGVAAVISPKKRAIAVRVDKVIGVAGFVHPGNRVDVLVSLRMEKNQVPVTKTILENILVLAAGPETETTGKEAKASLVEVITLEVTPEEAERLALSVTEGKILLALRNFNDPEDVMTKGMTIPVLLASYSSGAPVKETRPIPVRTAVTKRSVPEKTMVERKVESVKTDAQKKPADAEKKPVYVVELIKGGKLSQVKFEEGE